MRTILLFLIPIITFAQNLKNDWQKENLKGKVKSVKSVTYQYVNNNGKMERGALLPHFNTLEEYNSKGFKIKGSRFSDKGKTTSAWLYSYDENNYLTKVEIFNDKSQIEEVLKYTFEPKAQTETVIGYNANGVVSGQQIITYNDKGNKINELSLNANNEFLLNQSITYDSKQNVSEKKFEDKEGKRVVLEYVYDDKNNVIQENYYGEGKQLYGQKIFSYKYDNQGNWIERTESIYEVERVMTQREIEYY